MNAILVGAALVLGASMLILWLWLWPRRRRQPEPRMAPLTAPLKAPPIDLADADALLRLIQGTASLPFESPGRGALCLARLGYGLPQSESLPQLSEAQRAIEAITRTLRHPHEHEHYFDQFGAGRWFEFRRHVTEGEGRWDFTVRVLARADGAFIHEADVVRPGDREDEEVDQGDSEPAPAEAAVPQGMVACPCCGHATLSGRGLYAICPVCFWEDDGQDSADADEERGGPNTVSLTAGRKGYLRSGASVEKDLAHVRPPTAEERRLRHFDPEGRELPEGGDGVPPVMPPRQIRR